MQSVASLCNLAAASKDHAASAVMIAHLMQRYGYDVNDEDHMTGDLFPLDDASIRVLRRAVVRGNMPAAEVLIKLGADATDAVGFALGSRIRATPRRPAMLRLLLEHGADPTRAVTGAIFVSYLSAARLCFDFGADLSVAKQHLSDGREDGGSDVNPLTLILCNKWE